MLDEVEEQFHTQPQIVLADSGSCNERDLADLETRGVDGYVSVGQEDKAVTDRDLEKHPATGRMVEQLSTPDGWHRTTFAQLMPGWQPVKARLDGMAEVLLNERPDAR